MATFATPYARPSFHHACRYRDVRSEASRLHASSSTCSRGGPSGRASTAWSHPVAASMTSVSASGSWWTADRSITTPGPDQFRCTLRSEEHTSELQTLMRNSYAGFCLQKQHKYM